MLVDFPGHVTELVLDRVFPTRVRSALWIVSPGFDLFLLVFVPLLTVPILAAYYFGNPLIAVGGVITLSFAHYLSSFTFYLWDENKAYHRERWLAFFVGPIVLAVLYAMMVRWANANIIPFLLFFWNAVHVAKQNCGILSVYRVRAGVTDMSHRNASNRAIIAMSLFLAMWNMDTHREVSAIFGAIRSDFGRFLWFGSGVIAAVTIGMLVWDLRKRMAKGEAPKAPEVLFLLASLAFFYPFIFIRSSEMATVAMLLPHYIQYMAIVWLVHRRKFGEGQGGVGTVMRKISRSTVLLIPTLAVAGFSFYLFFHGMTHAGLQAQAVTIFILVAFEHFYLDTLNWSFRRAHIRRTIGPALTGPAVYAA